VQLPGWYAFSSAFGWSPWLRPATDGINAIAACSRTAQPTRRDTYHAHPVAIAGQLAASLLRESEQNGQCGRSAISPNAYAWHHRAGFGCNGDFSQPTEHFVALCMNTQALLLSKSGRKLGPTRGSRPAAWQCLQPNCHRSMRWPLQRMEMEAGNERVRACNRCTQGF